MPYTTCSKISKDRARVAPEISSRTDRHRHTYSSQYYATAHAGELITDTLSTVLISGGLENDKQKNSF